MSNLDDSLPDSSHFNNETRILFQSKELNISEQTFCVYKFGIGIGEPIVRSIFCVRYSGLSNAAEVKMVRHWQEKL
jgi:hypothetical protein